MARWTFEPGHTAAEFCVRHMMVTYVRGHFKDVRGFLEFDPAKPRAASAEVTIPVSTLWTGERDRDAHLKSADFLDAEKHPLITFRSRKVVLVGDHDYRVPGNLTIRGISREVTLDVRYLGQWQTPWWENGIDKGPKTRAGFVGTGRIDRHDFGVSWNAEMQGGGVVVGATVEITVDAEAILDAGVAR